MGFASIEDTLALEKAMSWEQRDVAKTLFGLLSETADKFPERPAISYQLLSGPQDKAETLNWRSLQQKTAQAANMFRALGVGPEDVVAFVLPKIDLKCTFYAILSSKLPSGRYEANQIGFSRPDPF